MSSITLSPRRRCARRRSRGAQLRIDWWASAISISAVAPTTSEKTPRSKKSALAACTLADQRQLDIARMRRQERIAEQPGRRRRSRRRAEARGRSSDRPDAEPVFHPARAAGHVLQDEGDRQRDAGGKAAAGQVVAAQEQVERQHDDDREQPLHDHGRHQQVVADRVAGLAVGLRLVSVLARCCCGELDALGRRPETAQQRVDRERDHAEDGDLAQRVEAAEVDEDHVDDVACRRLPHRPFSRKKREMVSGSGRVMTA